MADIFEDDGTLACLHIPADRANKRFQCPEEQQTNLVNKTFWVVDYFPEVTTKFGIRHLFKMKYNLDDAETEARKVFTGASDICYVLDWLGENGKLPIADPGKCLPGLFRPLCKGSAPGKILLSLCG